MIGKGKYEQEGKGEGGVNKRKGVYVLPGRAADSRESGRPKYLRTQSDSPNRDEPRE